MGDCYKWDPGAPRSTVPGASNGNVGPAGEPDQKQDEGGKKYDWMECVAFVSTAVLKGFCCRIRGGNMHGLARYSKRKGRERGKEEEIKEHVRRGLERRFRC